MKARRWNSVAPGGTPPSAHTKAIPESEMSAPPAACYATAATFPPDKVVMNMYQRKLG